MGSLHVEFVKPSFRRFANFSDRLEEPAIQTLFAKDAVERVVMPILPWTPGIDAADLDLAIFDPFLDLLCDELRDVVHHEEAMNSHIFVGSNCTFNPRS